MRGLGKDPFRCRRCNYRFYRKLLPGEVLGLPDPPVEPIEVSLALPSEPQPKPGGSDSVSEPL